MAKGVYDFISNMDKYPFHMPGHKRNGGFKELCALGAWADITEIQGADDLHNPKGILLSLAEKAARRWGADKSYVLTNGSTCGNLAAMGALGKRGDTVLVARNCHRSVYHGLELFGYRPVFVTPDYVKSLGVYGSLSPQTVEAAIKANPKSAFLVMTSPTYEGVISDIKTIAELCHRANIALLVDEAHGAHLDLSPYFTGGAVKAGADAVVQSLHKTLPALTPAALLHVCGDRVDRQRLAHYLRVFQSSSPSYPLMASIELCVEQVGEEALFKGWFALANDFENRAKVLNDIKIFSGVGEGVFTHDPSKLVITGKDGLALAEFLRFRGIETEYATRSFVLAMTGAGDRKEGFDALFSALAEADELITSCNFTNKQPECCNGTVVLTIEEALNTPSELLDVEESVGKIAAEYVWAYPPGIPLLVPGQRITAEFAAANLENCISDRGALPMLAVVNYNRTY